MTVFDALKIFEINDAFIQLINMPLIRAYDKDKNPVFTKLRNYVGDNAIEDQRECIYDFLTKNKAIINQYCGWGKSFVVTAFIKICLELKLNKILNRPMIFVLSAPLTALSKGNQLEKDLMTLWVEIIKKRYNVKICEMCSGIDLLSDKENLKNILRRFLHNEKFTENEFRKYFKDLDHLVENISIEKINYYVENNLCDAIIIYTCDNSLGKLNDLNADIIDFLGLDEAHVHFLNGGRNNKAEDITIANSVIKLIENNNNMIVRSWTATPTYLEGCEKSTWNRKIWGPELTYTSYNKAVKLKWALPIGWAIYDTFDKNANKYIFYDNFIKLDKDKKTSYIYKTTIEMVEKYKILEGSMKKAKLLVKCQTSNDFNNAYRIYDDFVKNNNSFTKEYDNNPMVKFIDEGNTVIASTSSKGFIVLNKKGFLKFKGVAQFIAKAKDDEFYNDYLSNDVIAFNIRQFSTGHDLNFFNCGCIMDNCYNDDFIQFLFRSGRLAELKTMNFIFISSMCCNLEHVKAYKNAIIDLFETTDAFSGIPHIIGRTGNNENNPINENEIILFDKKLIELECQDCGKADTRYKDCNRQTLWNEYRMKNRFDAIKHLDDEAYKNKIVNDMLRKINNEIKATRTYND